MQQESSPDHDVYAPPKSPVARRDPDRLDHASKGQRFLNYLIDQICFVAVFSVLLGFLIMEEDLTDPEAGSIWIDLVALFALPTYYLVIEASTGRSLGKFLTGTKVVGLDGDPPTFLQVLGRSFARLVPFEPFSYLGSRPWGWHDSLSKTRVVRTRGTRRGRGRRSTQRPMESQR